MCVFGVFHIPNKMISWYLACRFSCDGLWVDELKKISGGINGWNFSEYCHVRKGNKSMLLYGYDRNTLRMG